MTASISIDDHLVLRIIPYRKHLIFLAMLSSGGIFLLIGNHSKKKKKDKLQAYVHM